MKRAFDIIVATLGLLVFLPVIIVVAIVVRWKLGAPVLFKQARPGLNSKPFTLLKFRTMTDGVGADGKALPDEERLTGLGKRLRQFSLDELPQLLNVLRGEMSIVGPRPLLMAYLAHYSPEQARRHEVRPGITGWAQVNGRNAVDWPERLGMDVWYVDNTSFRLDMKIIMMTIDRVLRRRDVSAEGHATMYRFDEGPPK